MKKIIILLVLIFLSNTAYSHYQVKDVKTSTKVFSFNLVHKYLPGHEFHNNTCRKEYSSNKLELCELKYEVTSGGNKKLAAGSGSVDLRGNGSYDDELMSANSHYDALRVAERHGINLTVLVEIPRESITSLIGGDNRYTVATSSSGRVCDANSPSTCQTYNDSGYTRDK